MIIAHDQQHRAGTTARLLLVGPVLERWCGMVLTPQELRAATDAAVSCVWIPIDAGTKNLLLLTRRKFSHGKRVKDSEEAARAYLEWFGRDLLKAVTSLVEYADAKITSEVLHAIREANARAGIARPAKLIWSYPTMHEAARECGHALLSVVKDDGTPEVTLLALAEQAHARLDDFLVTFCAFEPTSAESELELEHDRAIAAAREGTADEPGEAATVAVDLKRNIVIIDGTPYDVEPHESQMLAALAKAEDNATWWVTGPDLRELPACGGKNIAREICKLQRRVPALEDRIISRKPMGYRFRS